MVSFSEPRNTKGRKSLRGHIIQERPVVVNVDWVPNGLGTSWAGTGLVWSR